jgi:hypothetical protein
MLRLRAVRDEINEAVGKDRKQAEGSSKLHMPYNLRSWCNCSIFTSMDSCFLPYIFDECQHQPPDDREAKCLFHPSQINVESLSLFSASRW